MKLYITPEAQKQFKCIDSKGKKKIEVKLLYLEKDPLAGNRLSGEMRGLYSFRAWPYRIIYLINKKKELWVVSILHRQGAYK